MLSPKPVTLVHTCSSNPRSDEGAAWSEHAGAKCRTAQSSGRPPSFSALVRFVVLAMTGILVVLGCLLALYLEASGLGAPRDTWMRSGYSALLIMVMGAGILMVVVPVVILRRSHRLVIALAVLISVVTAVAALGVLGT